MERQDQRRRRLEQFLELARDYRGWNRAQLAAALNRDATKIVPDSGNPKLDFVFRLAAVVDWSVGDVAEAIGALDPDEGPRGEDHPALESTCFKEVDAMIVKAHETGRYADMVTYAVHQRDLAETPDEQAIARIREAGGWDGLGRYAKGLEALRAGMQISGVSDVYSLKFQVNLANSHYTLWRLVEGRALANEVVSFFMDEPPQSPRDRATLAFARYVRGHCYRRQAADGGDNRVRFATRAKNDLETAAREYTELAQEFDRDPPLGIARTCRGGILEASVDLGEISPEDAVHELSQGLDAVVDLDACPGGDWLESFGWWCIFGCNIALRYLEGAEQQSSMALFTNKAYEIADRLDNWAMRERTFTMEHFRRQRLNAFAGVEADWVIDPDEVRVITGTMGRFPLFRQTGWTILESAKIVREN